MTVSELSIISAISEKQVTKRWKEIRGAKKEDGVISFPEGSRYPFDLHRYKLINQEKRRLALLDAISCYRYVDNVSLKMPEESFKSLVKELCDAGLIRKNGTHNQYGANAYDTTIRYDEIRSHNIRKRISEITNIVASASGHFVGSIVAENLSA